MSDPQQQLQQQQQQQPTVSGGYSGAVSVNENSVTHEYIEVDTTAVNDPYHIPTSAKVNLAIHRTCGEDPDRNVFVPGPGKVGMYRIETKNIEQYRNLHELKLDEHHPPIAAISIRKEKIMIRSDGKITRNIIRDPNDQLTDQKE